MKAIAASLLLFMAFLTNSCVTADSPQSTRIALIQLPSSKVGDFSAMLAYAKAAKSQGAQMVVFPEESAFGWLNPNVFYEAKPIPGETVDAFSAIAKEAGIWVVAGLAERGRKIATNPDTYEVYDSGIVLDSNGALILHQRQHNVIKNAFSACPATFGSEGCSYTPGRLDDARVVETMLGRLAILVCADAYTYDPSALDALKAHRPDIVIVPWGVTAGSKEECGKEDFNAAGYAAKAAAHLKSAYVVGANGVGPRPYGRFLPSWYCGTSGFATPDGQVGGVANGEQELAIFDIPIRKK
ncbi:MAG: carbon-nitrogen hydrolase family protein [Reyranella sp.]|nr:carbon-nitrogen hydrolase family protein [Reyranella sp.]MDP3161349.1 carbon-nitrogen hydrolase family protein [Reyranella sp.]